MKILEALPTGIPTTWLMVGCTVAIILAQFLFGEKSFIRDLFKSKEKKADERMKRENDLLAKQETHIKVLEDKINVMQIEINELKSQLSVYKNNIQRYEDFFAIIQEYVTHSHPEEAFASKLFEAMNKIKEHG
jgi:predicted RNase H-like nuclease (RuvC/YqgF family)